MCDTFVYVPEIAGASVWFGKNSDREPNEAQQIVRYPSLQRFSGRVKATHREVEVPPETSEVILSKPFQMWGAEMGGNAHGVVIGNEAVFTKFKKSGKSDGLTGMDLLRLALEYSSTAEEALHNIIANLEKYGQQADGGYRKRFFYDNAFIIADSGRAYVLETAGREWAWKRVRGYRAISNGLSIGEDFDGLSKNAEAIARKKGWMKRGETFDFRKAFATKFMPRMAASDQRRASSEEQGKQTGSMEAAAAMRILRSHGSKDFHPAKGKTDSICMHANGMLCPSQTTGSMVAELRKEGVPTLWLTGSSAPCLSVFKPFYFGSDVLNEAHFTPPGATMDHSYWWTWEAFHRAVLLPYKKHIASIRRDQQALERDWIGADAPMQAADPGERTAFSNACIEASLALLDQWKESVKIESSLRHFRYQRYWNKLNRKV